MLVTSVLPAAHMHRRAVRGDVAAAFLHAGSIAVALLHAGSIAVALLRAARALSVQKRYANEWDVQKRHGSERGGGRCGARGVSAASGTARRGERRNEGNGATSSAARRAGRHSEESGSAKRGVSVAKGARVRGHAGA